MNLHSMGSCTIDAWIDMQRTSSLCVEIQPVQSGPSRLLGKCATFQRSRVLSLLCTCADNHPLVWLYVWLRHVSSVYVRAHVFAHFLYLSMCICASISSSVCVCYCVCVRVRLCACGCQCVFHAEHCLLETLSKSPQCDNWLPGVLVSLLLIIVIPCRKKKECVLDEIGEVCSFAGENWSQVCPNSFGKKKLWGNETAGPDPVQPGCRLLSAVVMA